MSLLQSSLFDNYVSDVAVTMVVGLGYYLFNSLKKKKTTWKDQNKEIKNLKNHLEVALGRYEYAKTIEEYNNIIKNDYEKSDDPFAILNQMMKKGLVPDIETYNALLLNALQTGNCQSAKLLMEEILDVTGPVSPNNYTLNILVKGVHLSYFKNIVKTFEKQEKLQENFDLELNEIIKKFRARGIELDIIIVNTIIDCLIEQGRMEKTWEIFNFYKNSIKPDNYTYTTLLKGIKKMSLNAEWLNRAFLILEEAKIGYNLEEEFFNSLLDSCVKYNKIEKAVELFKEMKEKSKNNLSEYAYSMMIKVYGKIYKLDKCLEMLNAIKSKGTVPSAVTYVCLINVCLRCRKVDVAEKLLQEVETNCEKEVLDTVYFNIINGYKNNKSFEKAKKIFDKHYNKDNRSISTNVFNAYIDCCVQFNRFDSMVDTYNKMLENKVETDVFTLSILLKGFCNWNKVEKTIEIYNHTKKRDITLDEFLYNHLMDMFVQNNNEEYVNIIYKDMKNKGFEIGSGTYGVLMKLFQLKGDHQKAYDLLDDMFKKEITPTESIYQTVIELQIKGKNLSRAIALFKNMLLAKIVPSNPLCETVINACKAYGKDVEGLELVMSAMNEKIKIDNSIIDKLIDGIISSYHLQVPEKIDILSKFSMTLKELSLLINCLTYDRLSKFLFQNKTLNKLSSFSESSIYSTAPVANTVTANYTSNNKFVEESKNNFYESNQYVPPGQYDNYAISRNPFIKKQAPTQNIPYNNKGNMYNTYQSGYNNYYTENTYDNSYKPYNYNNNKNYSSGLESSIYSNSHTKSLYNSGRKDEVYGGSFKRGVFHK
jgi:pentatricopeptide repeat protein